jgi:hypothetical protein
VRERGVTALGKSQRFVRAGVRRGLSVVGEDREGGGGVEESGGGRGGIAGNVALQPIMNAGIFGMHGA